MIVKLLVLAITFLSGIVLAWPVIRLTEGGRRRDW